MSRNLLDELFAQVNRLERQNERLQATVDRLDREKEVVCKYTQFASWPEFVRWIIKQHQGTRQVECSDRPIWTPEGSVSAIHQLVSTPLKASSDSMKTSEIQQEGHAWSNGEFTREALASRFSENRLAFTFSKTKESVDTLADSTELDWVECIVLENSRLRRLNGELERQLLVVRQSMQSLARLIPTS